MRTTNFTSVLKPIFNTTDMKKIINTTLGKCPIKTTDHFFGVLHTGEPKLKHFLSYLNFRGTAEICCHPGKENTIQKDRLYKTRKKELDILTSDTFMNKIKEQEIQLITFKEL